MLACLGVPNPCEDPNDYGLPNTPVEHSPLAAMVSNLGMKGFFPCKADGYRQRENHWVYYEAWYMKGMGHISTQIYRHPVRLTRRNGSG
jgi:hypothetical protein